MKVTSRIRQWMMITIREDTASLVLNLMILMNLAIFSCRLNTWSLEVVVEAPLPGELRVVCRSHVKATMFVSHKYMFCNVFRQYLRHARHSRPIA